MFACGRTADLGLTGWIARDAHVVTVRARARQICGQAADLGIHVAKRRRNRYSSYMCSDGSGDVLADLEAALDRLAGEDLKSLFGPQVLDRTRRLMVAEEPAGRPGGPRRCARGSSPGPPSTTGRPACSRGCAGTRRLSPAAAHRLVATGRALDHLPAVAAAFAAGRLTAEQVAVIAPVARPENLAAAAAQGSTWPASTRRWPRPPPPARTGS